MRTYSTVGNTSYKLLPQDGLKELLLFSFRHLAQAIRKQKYSRNSFTMINSPIQSVFSLILICKE